MLASRHPAKQHHQRRTIGVMHDLVGGNVLPPLCSSTQAEGKLWRQGAAVLVLALQAAQATATTQEEGEQL